MSKLFTVLSDSDDSTIDLFETGREKTHIVSDSDTDSDITVDLQETNATCLISDSKGPLSENLHVTNSHSENSVGQGVPHLDLVETLHGMKEDECTHIVSDTDSDTSVHLLKNTSHCIKHTSSTKNNAGPSKKKYTNSAPNISKTGHCKSAETRRSCQISDSDSDEVELNRSRGMKRVAPPQSDGAKNKRTNKRQEMGRGSHVTDVDNRPMCKYGTKCYRKNPVHFQEFRHPDKEQGRHEENSSPHAKRTKTIQKRSSQTLSSTASTAHPSAPSSSASRPLNTAQDIVLDAQPFCFLLTKVAGISATHNARLAVSLRGEVFVVEDDCGNCVILYVLSSSMGNLQKSVQFNYMFDIPWLVSQYPTEFSKKPLLLVHGFQRREKADIDLEASQYDNIRLCQARLQIMYGTHHSKMMLLLYDSGLRVVIHTANLVHSDWHQKSQGVWVSPVFPKLASGCSPRDGDSETGFKRDLLEYLRAYKQHHLEDWIRLVGEHDMSSSQVCIIASVPGRHTGATKSMFGHLKLRKMLEQLGPDPGSTRSWPVIGQFSSIGSLGATKDTWLCKEWLQSLASGKRTGLGLETTSSPLLLVYPSKDTVRESLEGYPAGGSLPYSIEVAKKQPYLHDFWHHWRSEVRGRTRACPHIKTYTRVSPDCQHLSWFLVTSANLSKAAWGALEKNGSQLMIRSYEIGVLFLPKFFGSAATFHPVTAVVTNPVSEEIAFPVPFDLPLQQYSAKERPWVWDIPYVDKPDVNGNKWCPPLR